MKKITSHDRIYAAQLTVENAEEMAAWTGGELFYTVDRTANGSTILLLRSFGINSYVAIDDWVVKDQDGDFFGYSEENFEEIYGNNFWIGEA